MAEITYSMLVMSTWSDIPIILYPLTFALLTSSEGRSSPSLKNECVWRSIMATSYICQNRLMKGFLECLPIRLYPSPPCRFSEKDLFLLPFL